MPTLDVKQALAFLDMLDPNGRHAIASEAPFGRDGLPKWEGGATYEAHRRQDLIKDIQKRQSRGSNLYYSVNRPCEIIHHEGNKGKCNADDIIAIRAMAIDADVNIKNDPTLIKSFLAFVDQQLTDALRPSLVINTGGGFQLIYILNTVINVQLFRPATSSEQRDQNDQVVRNRNAVSKLIHEFENWLRSQVPHELIKIDNMSNVDRVMRLPGTINFPKAEKRAKGQVEALAHIAVDYQVRCDIHALREIIPECSPVAPQAQTKRQYIPGPNDLSTYEKARICCEWIRDCGAADTNESYTHNVMFPLLGEVREGNLTLEQAEELFLEAVSGGERYGTAGRGIAYFRRQWRSHIHSNRNGRMTLGTLVKACKEHGMPIPWKNRVVWEDSYEEQLAAIQKLNQSIDDDTFELLKHIK